MSLRFESDRGMPEGRIARGVRFEYKIWFNNNRAALPTGSGIYNAATTYLC